METKVQIRRHLRWAWLGAVILTVSVGLLGRSESAQPGSAERVSPSDRVTTFVHVRSSPNGDSPDKGRLLIGQSLPLVRSVPLWYEVQLPDGTTGFVSKAWTSVSHPLAARETDELRLHFLDIGAGTCTVVECPGPNAPPMIVDCGSLGGTSADMSLSDVKSYVTGILQPSSARPNLVVSHPDRDHYRFIADTLESTQLDHIWQGGDGDEYTADGFPAWLQAQRSGGATVHSGMPANWHNDGQPLGDELSCGSANTYVLTVNTGQEKNTQSIVLMIEYHEFTAILTGDAEGETEARALANFDHSLKATVLSGSHHGASTKGSNSATWAQAVAPDVVIFSAGDKFFHPRCAATARFTMLAETREHMMRCGDSAGYRSPSRTNRALFVTEVSGTVVVSSNGHSPMAIHCSRAPECGGRITH